VSGSVPGRAAHGGNINAGPGDGRRRRQW
jgi:hypothetical protein